MCKDDWGFGHGFAFRGFPFGPGRSGALEWGARGSPEDPDVRIR